MEILDLITRVLYIIAIVVVVVGPLATMILTCRQVTGTWNVRHFFCNRKYWALSILNWRYREKKAEGLSTRDFIRFINSYYLANGFVSRWKFMKQEERTLFVEILSNPGFIEENLGLFKYTVEEHARILAAWEKLKKFYDGQIDQSDNVELY